MVVPPDPNSYAASNVLGKFRLIAELGRGGMSEVYLAVIAGPAGFNKLVVLKLIKAELAEDPDFITMFLAEARLSARLSHPHVVQTNDVGEASGRYYIAMEYLEGQPYSRILHRLGRDRGLPLGMSLRILSDVLQGLHYAHELTDFDGSPLGVVHRDVTPHNVFVTYDGQVKVVDFGIAKAMNSSHETRTGMLKGKVGYMAPEQAKGERVDRRADIFSVGVMLWEAAVGRRLWKGMNDVQVLHQLLAGDIPSPRSMRPDISARLEAIIMRAVSVDRDRRHSSAVELQGELEELMDTGNERSTLREIGRLLSQTFDDERRKLKGIIEQQLATSAMMATGVYQQISLPRVEQPPNMTGELPRFSGPRIVGGDSASFSAGTPSHSGVGQPSMAPMGMGPMGPGAPGYHNTGSFQALDRVSYPMANPQTFTGGPMSVPQGARVTSSGLAIPRLGPTSMEPGHSSQPSVSSSLGQGQSYPARSASSGGKLTLAALGFAAAAGSLAAILYVGLGRTTPSEKLPAGTATTAENAATGHTDATSHPTPSAEASAAPTASAEAVAERELNVTAQPPDASIFLDEEKIGTGSVRRPLPADGKEHELRIEAPGFSTKVRRIATDEVGTITWDTELTRVVGGARPNPIKTQEPNSPPLRDKNGKLIRNLDKQYPGG